MTPILSREQVNAMFAKGSGQVEKGIQKNLDKIIAGDFSGEVIFKVKDWYDYFKYKAKKRGVNYCASASLLVKEKAVIKSIMENYEPVMIKAMIDTAWDVNHKLMKPDQVSIFIMSKSFLRSLVPLAQKYMQGLIDEYGNEYDPRIHVKKNEALKEGGIWIAGRKIC
jgi:hypothetical protein